MQQSQLITITPEMAELFLTKNVHNRKISKQVVEGYVYAMKNGNWKVNGDAIRFDWNGNLIDGQHRLEAIIKSNTNIETWIITGIDPASITTMDKGKNRTTHENILFEHPGYNANQASQITTAIAQILLYDNGQSVQLGGGSRGLKSFESVNGFLTQNKSTIDNLLHTIQSLTSYRTTIMPYSSLLFIYFVCNRVDPVYTNDFMYKLITGANLDITDQIYKLRDIIIKSKNSDSVYALKDHERIYTVLKCFNGIRKNKAFKSEAAMKWKMSKNELLPVVK